MARTKQTQRVPATKAQEIMQRIEKRKKKKSPTSPLPQASVSTRTNAAIVPEAGAVIVNRAQQMNGFPSLGAGSSAASNVMSAAKIDSLISRLDRLDAKMFNSSCGGGLGVPYQVVCNAEGLNPTLPPCNLPALHNVNDIIDLSPTHCAAYVAFYGLPAPVEVSDQKRAIAALIGASAQIA